MGYLFTVLDFRPSYSLWGYALDYDPEYLNRFALRPKSMNIFYYKCYYYFLYYDYYNSNISIHGSPLLTMLPREDARTS